MKFFALLLLVVVAQSYFMFPKHDISNIQNSLTKVLKEDSRGFSSSQLISIRAAITRGGVVYGSNKSGYADYLKTQMRNNFGSCWNVVIYLNSTFQTFSCYPENFGTQFSPRWFNSGFTLPHGFYFLMFQCNKFRGEGQKDIKIEQDLKEKGPGVTNYEEETINNAISAAISIQKDNPYYNARYIYSSILDIGEFWRVCIGPDQTEIALKYTSPMDAWIQYGFSGPYKWHYYIWRDYTRNNQEK